MNEHFRHGWYITQSKSINMGQRVLTMEKESNCRSDVRIIVVMDQLLKNIHTGLAYYKNNPLHIGISLKFIMDFYYTAKNTVSDHFRKYHHLPLEWNMMLLLPAVMWFKCEWSIYKPSIIQFSRTNGRHWASYNIRSNCEANDPVFITIVSI